MAKYVGRSKQRFYAKKTAAKIMVSCFLVIVACGTLLCYGRQQKGWKTSIYSMEDDNVLSHPSVHDSRSKKEVRADFEQFLQEVFRENVTSDGITLNYTLKNPTDYGIKNVKPALGHYTKEAMQNARMLTENELAVLERYDYDKLNEEQQLAYDVLHTVWKQDLSGDNVDEYQEPLSPTTGTQTQLPVILTEYHFWDKESVDTYLQLLQKIPDYFDEIITFEQQRAKEGLFMSKRTAQDIITQCKEFVALPEKNFMLTTFPERLSGLTLTAEQKADYAKRNRSAVLQNVIPAYQKLIKALEELADTGKNQAGLCNLPKGKAYYQHLVRSMVGTDRSMKNILKLLDQTIEDNKNIMSDLLVKDGSIYEKALSVKYPEEEPDKTLQYLKKQIKKSFPDLPSEVSCQMKYVDKSLEEHISPAFYLTTPLDAYQDNVIYLNGNAKYDLTKAFTTIAHEGYPGHLFQNCYFREKNKHPLRYVLNFPAYTEGYATYAEIYSYQFLDATKEEIDILQNNAISTHCLYALCDIGIHAKHWNRKKLSDFLSNHGIVTTDNARAIYETIIDSPGSYLPYTIGYLEICRIRDTFQKAAGKYYSPLLFHTFLLDTGPTSFPVLERQINGWLKEKT